MKKGIFLISLIVLFYSCSQKTEITNSEETVNIFYTDSINGLELKKQIVEILPSGQEKAIVFFTQTEVPQLVKEVHFYANGRKQVEGTLKNKQRHGKWTFWYDNGKVWSEGLFINGKSEGLFSVFNKDGSIKIKSYYKNGEKIRESYFENQKCIKTINL